ncbi:hypothetical protein TWF481_000776 [Arthrobotrys musiformis]|uniref:Uncharacterized protein n=1 Tax=Arthrobotrys musiformis TaxID=47236 RepID=A0AAV9WNS0_9PEZI
MMFILVFALGALPFSMAIEWEDFANNLATDLAPLITLFGEQVTKQFMSESLSIWDNIIFAMAPLGILTALVSVIRVCGNSSLRAFIGRAQESPGIAEAELLSCVSETTSELWHGGGIARVFGTPQILEVVRVEERGLPWHRDQVLDPGPPSDLEDITDSDSDAEFINTSYSAGIYSLKECVESRRGTWELKKGELSDREWRLHHSPNMSLNFGIKRLSSTYTYAATVLGVALQTGVLVFAGLTVYKYPTEFLVGSDGKLVEKYAFPLTLIGTILLCLGMFLCAFIIERSTDEFHLKRKQKGIQSKIYWVQSGGQKIGDQVFESFVQVSDEPDYIISLKSDHMALFSGRILWAAVVTTMLGFVVQFVGLRAIHSSVIMAQLGATLVMAVIRAGLRAKRKGATNNLIPEDQLGEIRGHELDFLAMRFEKVDSVWVGGEHGGGLEPELPTYEFAGCNGFNALKSRARLGRMTDRRGGLPWKGVQGRETASQLQRTIEGVMEFFSARLASASGVRCGSTQMYYWPISLHTSSSDNSSHGSADKAHEAYFFEIKYDGLVWKIDRSEIEALVAMWTWSILQTDNPIPGLTAVTHNRLISRDTELGDALHFIWIQRKLPSRKCFVDSIHGPGILYTGRAERQFRRLGSVYDVHFGCHEPYSGLWFTRSRQSAPKSSSSSGSALPTRFYDSDNGATTPPVLDSDNGTSAPSTFDNDNVLPASIASAPGDGSRAKRTSVLSVATENSIQIMCAQDIFITFLGALIQNIERIGGETTLRASSDNQPSFLLQNSEIEEIADRFESRGLGSRGDAYMCIIPCLAREGKMPGVPSSVLNTALGWIKNYGKERLIAFEVTAFLEWVCFGSDTDEDIKPYAELADVYHGSMLLHYDELSTLPMQQSSDSDDSSSYTLRLSNKDTFVLYNGGVSGVCRMLKNATPGSPLSIIAQQYGWIGLRIAAEGNDERNVSKLKDHGAREDMVPNYTNGRQLWEWAEENNTTVMRYLLANRKLRGNDKGPDGRTSLSWAAFHGNIDAVKLLLEKNADRNICDQNGYVPLLLAAEQGHHRIVEILLNGDTASLNLRLPNGMTALMLAANRGDEKTVERLLQEPNIEVNARSSASNQHRNAFDFAFAGGHLKVGELLLEKKTHLSYMPEEILRWGNENKNQKIVDLIIVRGLDYSNTLWDAVEEGHFMIVESLIRQKKEDSKSVEVHRSTGSLLSLAADRRDIAELLVKEEIYSTEDLESAAWNGHLELVNLLIDNGVGFTIDKQLNRLYIDGALSSAVEAGNTEIVKLIIEKTGRIHDNLLEIAREKEMVELLLDKGADLKAQGLGVARKAAQEGNVAVMETLINRGLDLLSCGIALEVAGWFGKTEVVKLLVEKGLDIKTSGERALNDSVDLGQEEVVEVLLAKGVGSDDAVQQAGYRERARQARENRAGSPDRDMARTNELLGR